MVIARPDRGRKRHAITFKVATSGHAITFKVATSGQPRMAAAAEAAAAALPSEGPGGVHFAIPEGTTTIKGVDWNGRGEDSWEEWDLTRPK